MHCLILSFCNYLANLFVRLLCEVLPGISFFVFCFCYMFAIFFYRLSEKGYTTEVAGSCSGK